MCERGEDRDITMVPCLQQVHPDGDEPKALMRWWMLPIDDCIAEIVRALNASGHSTTTACCGHGDVPGIIGLADGRALVIVTPECGEPLGDLALRLKALLDGTAPGGTETGGA